MSFDQLKYQFRDQWQAVEEDNDANNRRLKILKLVDMLVEWEIEQGEIHHAKIAKKRAVHWNNISQNMASESTSVVKKLDEKLSDYKEKITVANQQNSQQSEQIAELMEKVGVVKQQLYTLSEKIEHNKTQLSTLKELKALKTKVSSQETQLGISISKIEQGGDPYHALSMLESLWQLHSFTMAYYHEYYQANTNLQNQINGQDNNQSRATSIKLLIDVDDKLKQVDKLLSQQLNTQDDNDQTIKNNE